MTSFLVRTEKASTELLPVSEMYSSPEREQVLCRNVERFRGGLVFKAHRLLCLSTLGSRVIKKKKKKSIPRSPPPSRGSCEEREFFIDNLLVRIHFIIVMIRWAGLAPWECEVHPVLPSSFTWKL